MQTSSAAVQQVHSEKKKVWASTEGLFVHRLFCLQWITWIDSHDTAAVCREGLFAWYSRWRRTSGNTELGCLFVHVDTQRWPWLWVRFNLLQEEETLSGQSCCQVPKTATLAALIELCAAVRQTRDYSSDWTKPSYNVIDNIMKRVHTLCCPLHWDTPTVPITGRGQFVRF